MTAYNKLKIAILAVFASQSIHAITIDPVQIQSAPGELLYAEMSFKQANLDLPMHVGLASSEDLLSIGGEAQQNLDHLNFFVRRTPNGSGVITITSSQPYHAPNLNIVIKVQEGNATQLQRVQSSLKAASNKAPIPPNPHDQPLVPVRIVSEEQIALNLPLSSSQSQPPALKATTDSTNTTAQTEEIPKTPITKAEPKTPAQTTENAKVAQQASASTPKIAADTAMPMGGTTLYVTKRSANGELETHAIHSVVKDSPTMPTAKATPPTPAQTKTPAVTTKKATVNTATTNNNKPTNFQYSVQSKDSLWSIASRIAKEQNRSVQDVMEQIHQQNKQAFTRGDINRLKAGTVLNLDTMLPAQASAKETKVKTKADSGKQSAPLSVKTAPKTKYKLNQAEMSLVAEQEQVSNPNAAQKKANIPEQLSLNVMTTREKSVKLQRNVTNLELALRKKDQRLQLLNTRLAELQQQLEAQQAKQKSTS